MSFLAHDQSNYFTEEWSVTSYCKPMKHAGGPLVQTSAILPRIIKTTQDVETLNKVLDSSSKSNNTDSDRWREQRDVAESSFS